MIQIKNLSKEKPKETWDIKVCRPSPLGNIYHLKDVNDIKERNIVCDLYAKWFAIQDSKEFLDELSKLIDIFNKYGKLNLFCFCAPKRCHAETIKKYIEERTKSVI